MSKLKMYLSSLLAVCLVLLSFGSAASADPSLAPVSIELQDVSGVTGDTVTMDVYMDPGDHEVYAYKMNLAFDPESLEVESNIDHFYTSNVEVITDPFDTATAGSLKVETLYLIPIVGRQKIFSIDFKIKETATIGDSSVSVVTDGPDAPSYEEGGGGGDISIDVANITQGKIAIAAPPDTTPPTVAAKTDSTALGVADNLQLTFDENVTAVAGKNIVIKKAADDSVAATIAADDASQVSVADNVVTINPSDDLAYGTAYYATVDAGAFEDAANNPFAGVADNAAWTFATEAEPDTTPPTVTAKTDSTALGVADNLQLTFDENVTAVAGKNIVIKKAADDSVTATIAADDASQVSVADNVVTINPNDDLAFATAYYVQVDAGAFEDAVSNSFAGMADNATWTFATAAAAPGTVTFAIGSASGNADDTVEVPVSVAAASTGVASYGIQIDFDPAALEVESIDGSASGDDFLSNSDNEAGWLKAAWVDAAGGDNAISAGSLFTVKLKIKTDTAAGEQPLSVIEGALSSFTATDASRVEMQKTLTAGSVTVQAQQQPEPQTYHIKYNGNGSDGGSVPTDSAAYAKGDTVTVLGNAGSLTKAGYTFEGWNTKADGSGTSYNADATFKMGTSNVMLYAQWTVIPPVEPNPPSNPVTPPADNGVDILVNGKSESAGTATTATVSGQKVTTIAIDPQKLKAKLDSEASGAVVTIPVRSQSDVVVGELNGQMVKDMEQKQAILKIQTEQAAYTLPAQQIDISAVSNQIGTNVSLADIKVQVEIGSPQADTVKLVEDAAGQGAFQIVVPPLNFTVKAVYGDKTVDVSKFNAYVERTIAIPDGVDPGKITTGVVTDPDGTVRHVPTKITMIDGKYYAVINSLTNSTYSVVWHPVAFTDVQSHWAKDAVNDMGSRMVIDGMGDGLFSPDQNITRAEFAAAVVRALGLKLEKSQSAFADVDNAARYADAVQTAYDYKLIDGFDDGLFHPREEIAREQAVAIIDKAMAVTGLQTKLPPHDADALLGSYADAAKVSHWAKEAVADSLQAGIVTGRNGSELDPQASMTRAETAMMIQRLLQKSDLI